MIFDAKNRMYALEGVDNNYTYLVCVKTKNRIKVANRFFKKFGFKTEKGN